MDSASPVPLIPIRQRTRSLSLSSDEDNLEPSYHIPEHQGINAEGAQDPFLSQSGLPSLTHSMTKAIANYYLYTEQNAIARHSEHSKPLSRSGYTLKVQSGPPVVTKNDIKHALPGLVSCAISWLLIASFYTLVWLHKDRVISPHTKSTFDAVVVGLGIAFGLNIASGLKGIALDLRWWILNRRKRLSHEVCYARSSLTEHQTCLLINLG
jgi:hypothetical protein